MIEGTIGLKGDRNTSELTWRLVVSATELQKGEIRRRVNKHFADVPKG